VLFVSWKYTPTVLKQNSECRYNQSRVSFERQWIDNNVFFLLPMNLFMGAISMNYSSHIAIYKTFHPCGTGLSRHVRRHDFQDQALPCTRLQEYTVVPWYSLYSQYFLNDYLVAVSQECIHYLGYPRHWSLHVPQLGTVQPGRSTVFGANT